MQICCKTYSYRFITNFPRKKFAKIFGGFENIA